MCLGADDDDAHMWFKFQVGGSAAGLAPEFGGLDLLCNFCC